MRRSRAKRFSAAGTRASPPGSCGGGLRMRAGVVLRKRSGFDGGCGPHMCTRSTRVWALKTLSGLATALLILIGLPGGVRPVGANGGSVALNDPTRISRLAITINKSQTVRFGRAYGEALVAN